MDQPELGRRICELRKAKGLTQEELVEKCNINVRTLQRIEAGEVSPRSYTLRLLFAALDSEFIGAPEESAEGPATDSWLKQFYKYTIDLFNLKTNTMQKISILSALTFIVVITLFTSASTNIQAQTTSEVKSTIGESNKNFIRWFNNGQFDSLLSIYTKDACIVAKGCGSTFIQAYHRDAAKVVKFKELTSAEVTLSDSVAVEAGNFTLVMHSGEEMRGEYLTEWVRRGDKWLIRKDLPTITE